MSDDDPYFDIKKVHPFSAILGFTVSLVFYVLIPAFMILFFIPNFESIYTAGDITVKWIGLEELFTRWMYGGIPMAVLGGIVWGCPKGSRQRFVASVAYLTASLFWIMYFLNFGDLRGLVDITVDGRKVAAGMVFTLMLYLILFFRALKILIIYGVYRDERDKYLGGE